MDTPATDTPSTRKPLMNQHRLFDIAIILKGLNGLFEIIGGGALALIPAGAILAWVDTITHTELSNDPNDFLANALIHWAQHFEHKSQEFVAIYLLVHGLTKVLLVTLLWMGQKIAYPIAIVFFTLFDLYALHRLMLHWSWVLVAFLTVDVIIIGIIAREWLSEPTEPTTSAPGRV